jgi:glycosyltransferase involved in cell wall biosynthesis
MLVSLIVSTRGRTEELKKLMNCLEQQDYKSFEVIIVDQNEDDRLSAALTSGQWSFPISRVSASEQRGVSRGRNLGASYAKGDILLFPDDDCWYPTWFLSKGVGMMTRLGCASISGRPVDEETGRTINGRFANSSMWVDRKNIWITVIEWVVFFRRDAFLEVAGYDENLGPGAPSPWGANEGQDLSLRLLARGLACYYDSSLYGFHAELNTSRPDSAMIRKGRAYARGFGYVLRRHHYGIISICYWLVRPVGRSVMSLMKFDGQRLYYYVNVAIGRLEGWLGMTFSHTNAGG